MIAGIKAVDITQERVEKKSERKRKVTLMASLTCLGNNKFRGHTDESAQSSANCERRKKREKQVSAGERE